MTSRPDRPRVVVLGTGGTIAGSAAAATGRHYEAGALPLEALLDSAPALRSLADLETECVFSLDSVELDLERQLALARRVAAVVADPGITGVVVTHGTDTMEESAFLLHLLVAAPVPVVLTGAMRPADDPGADGPANLVDAVTVAIDPAARGLGALVVMGGRVHSGRDVTKRVADRVDAFASDHGPLGDVSDGALHLFARPLRRFGAASALDLDALPPALPRVELLYGHPEMSPRIGAAIVASGAAGIVHAGPGGGNVSTPVAAVLDEARAAGLVVVRASRVGAGLVTRDGACADTEHDWVAAGDLPPLKARALLALALAGTRDPARIQHLFDTH